jgi:hypothetical protein
VGEGRVTPVVRVRTRSESVTYPPIAAALVGHFGKAYETRYVTVVPFGFDIRLPGASLVDAIYAADLYLQALPVTWEVVQVEQ